MALVVFDRVQETTATTGTGPITLAGAVAGFQSFAVIGNGNTTYYAIVNGTDWEVGVGTYSTTGPSLARTTVLANSLGTTVAINLAGSSNVFVTYPAGKSVNLDASGNVSPLGTITSGVWNGTTIPVAYGGTGVTASSGANSVVLRDANQNIAVNRVNQSNTTTTAAGGTTTLTAASSYIHTLVGTGGQTYTLPDATTLATGVAFLFNNIATGTLTIQDYATGPIGTISSGGAGAVFLTSNATVGGTWDLHAYLPEGVTFGTNAFNLGTAVVSGGTWQGGTIAPAYGGTGLTTFVGANNALYSTGASTLTAGTLPILAGGTGATTDSGARTNLGLGTIATQNANAVAITGGSINGTTVGASTASTGSFTSLTDSGNLTFTGTGNRITGDFSNATHANRVSFQSSVTNGATSPFFIPNGTGNIASVVVANASDPTNSSFGQLVVAGTNDVRVVSGTLGTGTALPLTMYTGGGEKLRLTTAGGVSFGSSGTAFGTSGQILQSNGDAPPTWINNTVGTVTSVGGTGTVNGLTLTGTVTTSGNLTLGGTLSGTASGLSIGGNAATATSAPLLSALGNYVWTVGTLPSGYNLGIQTSFVDPTGWPNYGSVITAKTYSGGGGSLQMYVPYGPSNGGTGMQVRFGNYDVSAGNSWTAWKTLLASDNYTSYAPSLTGSGASGTWGINITGNAATATAAQGATFLTQPNATWGARLQIGGNGSGSGVANIAVVQATDGNLHMDCGVGKAMYLNYYNNGVIYLNGGTYQISANGSQYNGNAATATTAGAVPWSGITGRPSNIMFYEGFTLNADTMTTNSTGFTYAVSAPHVGPIARFSAGGSYDLEINAGYNNTNISYRARNGDANAWQGWNSFITSANIGSQSPNLTGTASNLTGWTTSGRNNSNEWIQFNNHSGLYSPLNNAHFYPNNLSYGSWRITGARNGWGGIEFDNANTSLMMNTDQCGFHWNAVGWRFLNSGGSGYFPGEVQAGYSDKRLKENFRPMTTEALEIINQLQTYRFNWNSKVEELNLPVKKGAEEVGCIAQEVQAVFPDAVVVNKSSNITNPDGTENESNYLTINYKKITPLLIQSVNELTKQIKELQSEIAILKAQK
jgi:hypothetical protein